MTESLPADPHHLPEIFPRWLDAFPRYEVQSGNCDQDSGGQPRCDQGPGSRGIGSLQLLVSLGLTEETIGIPIPEAELDSPGGHTRQDERQPLQRLGFREVGVRSRGI